MTTLSLLGGTALVTLLQMTLVPILAYRGMMPNVILLWLIAHAERIDRMRLMGAALAAGAILDIHFSHRYGLHSIVLLLTVYGITTPLWKNLIPTWYNRLLTVLWATVMYHLIYGAVLYFHGHTVTMTMMLHRLLSYEMPQNVAGYFLMQLVSRRLKPRAYRWFRM